MINHKYKILGLVIFLALSGSVYSQTNEPENLKDPTLLPATTTLSVLTQDQSYWGNDSVLSSKTKNTIISTANINSVHDIQSSSLLMDLKNNKVPKNVSDRLQKNAYAFGLQAGLAKGASDINAILDHNKVYYDQAYNFLALEIQPGLLPPVISEGRNTYRATGDNIVRLSRINFKIEFPARIVATPPRWQDYLIDDEPAPSTLNNDILPKNDDEKAIWDDSVTKGWNDGIEQAKENYQDNLGRLNRDFKGMIRYKALLAQGYIRKLEISTIPLGTTGGGNEMSLGEIVVKISETALLDPNKNHWIDPNLAIPETSPKDNN